MTSSRRRLILTLLVIGTSIVAAGCSRKPVNSMKPTAAAMPPSTIGQTSGLVSEEEAQDFAEEFIDCFYVNDPAAMGKMFDGETFAERVMEGVPLDRATSVEFKTATVAILASRENTVFRKSHELVQQGGEYKLLRIHEKDGLRWAMFRLRPPEGGVNHHDVALIRSKDGKCRGLDMYVSFTGELLSTTLKRGLLQLEASKSRSFMERLTGADKLMLLYEPERQAMTQAVLQGDGAEAVRLYRELPEEIQKEKTVMINRISACQRLGDDDEYLQALSDFRRLYPNDACIDAQSIAYFHLRQDYDAALDAVAAVQKAVGGDPYLDVIRGYILIDSQNHLDADVAFRMAIDGEPELADAWWGRILCLIKLENHADAIAVLKETDARFDVEWEELSTIDGYAGFTQSPYHQQWLDFLAQKEQPLPTQ